LNKLTRLQQADKHFFVLFFLRLWRVTNYALEHVVFLMLLGIIDVPKQPKASILRAKNFTVLTAIVAQGVIDLLQGPWDGKSFDLKPQLTSG
jgi:hypothetical protein